MTVADFLFQPMHVSTETIWGLRVLQKCWAEHYAEWAVGMLEAGYDSKNLRMLAGIEPRSSVFEAEDYFQRTVSELGLTEPLKETAIKAYSIYVAEQIIGRKVPARDGVKMLFRVCMESDYPKYLMIWFNLDDACDDIRCGGEPWSYPGLTKDNLEATVIKEAKAFIEDQREQINRTSQRRS
jgi:hypothetical protein